MRDSACISDDIIAAFEDMCHRLDERRRQLWIAYKEATSIMMQSEYESLEHECWSVLEAGLSGITAEQRMLERDFERRMAPIDDEEAIA